MVRGLIVSLALLLLTISGTTMAQDIPETPPLATFSISLAASPSNEPIVPITGLRTTSVNVTIACEQGSVYTDGPPAGAPPVIEYMINSTYPAASISGSPLATSLEFTPEGCLQGMEVTDTVDVDVSLAEHARYKDLVPMEVTATLEDGTMESVAWDHTVGVFFRHQVRVDESAHTMAPGTSIEVTGKVSNFGNAAMRFVFDELPDDARRVALALPDPLVVPPFTENEPFAVTIEAPASDSYTNRRDRVDLHVQALLDDDPNVAGDPVDLAFTVQTQSLAGESPGPALPFLVVFAAALVAGRGRGRSMV